ncbi:MAG: DUF1328 family protein [Pseudolabrys sp.]
MLKLALTFLLIAAASAIFGYTTAEAATATVAQMLFGVFVLLFFGALALGVLTAGRGPRLTA